MRVCRTIADIRATVAGFRAAGETVALVPTKGYLHAGHMALVAQAKRESQRIVTTIFVNPTQVGAHENLSTDPCERDLTMLREAGVDAVFMPDSAEIHPEGAQTIVETVDLAKILIGKLRPGHFRSVATDELKLVNIVQPDVACFGEKDYQQLCVIRQCLRDLHIAVRIVGVPTVREADGLAMSSRNLRLTIEDRVAAVILNHALTEAEEMARTGITASRLRAWVAAHIQGEPRANLLSADIRDARTLRTIAGPLSAPAVILLAVKFGAVLLIDQRVVGP